jgi:hypothetical protein
MENEKSIAVKIVRWLSMVFVITFTVSCITDCTMHRYDTQLELRKAEMGK